jgi:Spy/CpxP family protein refolding chaperone
MNKTLIAILSTAILLAAGTATAQQSGPGPGPGSGPCTWGQGMGRRGGAERWADPDQAVEAQLERMTWRLNLTADQKARLEPILRERQEMRAAQRQAMRDQIAAVLTPEQLAQFDQMGPRRGGRMGAGRGPGMGRGPGWNAPASAGQP